MNTNSASSRALGRGRGWGWRITWCQGGPEKPWTACSTFQRKTSGGNSDISSTNHAFQVGANNSSNIRIDSGKIIAVNASATATLNLQSDGGQVLVGSNIVKYFKNKNYNIVVIDRTIKEHNKIIDVEYLTFDLKDHENLNKFLKHYSFDYIFHEGAIVDTTYNFDDIFVAPGFATSISVERSLKYIKAKPFSNCDIEGDYLPKQYDTDLVYM